MDFKNNMLSRDKLIDNIIANTQPDRIMKYPNVANYYKKHNNENRITWNSLYYVEGGEFTSYFASNKYNRYLYDKKIIKNTDGKSIVKTN